MSAQGVKKRMGSRRQVKNKSPEVDEFYNRETTAEEHGVTTEGAEDVHKFSNIRRKLGSSRKNKRPPPGKDLEVSDGAAENTPEDDLLDASRVSSSTEEVEVTLQVPRESHRGFELQQHEHGRDKKSATLTHDESLRDSRSLSESHVMAEEAELRTEAQPDEELEDLHPAGGVVQTLDLTEVCDKELNTKPADSEQSQRRGGIEEVAEMLPQSDHEHRGAESSGSGTEETLKTTQWLVSTGPDEKESELTCEGETVTSEPPESFWSGSPPEVQNLNTGHPEPDDGDASGADEPPNTTVGQDREADGQVDDVKRRSDQLLQEHKDLPSEIEQSCSSQALQPEEGSCLDPQPQQSDACFTLTEHKRKLGSSRRHKGGRRPVDSEAEALPQSDHEHRGAESSGSGTEETLKTTQWLVSIGPDEKESELTCEDETVTSEPPESFWSGSPPKVQNLNTSHPEPDPEPFIPKSAHLPEDLRDAGSGVKLSDDDDEEEEAKTLRQQMNEVSSNEGELSVKPPSEAGFLLDCDLQEDVELLTASTAMMTVASDDVQDHQPAQKMNPVVSEEKYGQEDTDLSPDKEETNTETTSSESDIWRPTHHSCATTGFVTSEGLSLEVPHVALKDNRETTAEEHGVTTEGAEDVHKFSNIRRKLGSSRKNKRPPPGKDLEVSDGAAENTPEDDLLDASQVSSSTEEVEVTHQVPRESHRGFELQQYEHGRDKKSGTLTHDESLRDSRSLSESHVMAEEAELRTEAQPDEELEDLHPAGGVVQTLDLTEVCDKELKTKPADSEESQRRGGIEEVAEMLPQSDHELRGAESSGSGTEETLKTTQWLVSTGPDEKESELTCEGETVTSEPPESFWSGSPPKVQNLNTGHPEPDDGDASGADEPPNTTVGQDREADGQVDDVKRRSDQLLQEHKDLPSEIEQSCSSQALQPEEGSCLDPQPQQSDACFTLTEHKRKLGSSRRHKGGRRPVDSEAEALPQSDHEHRGAESSGSGTEETLKTTQWLVSTGPDEKESELTCEDETVTSEPPESFWSGSPPEVQNLNTSHPEPDPEPFIPKSAHLPEDLRDAGSGVKLSDDDDEEEAKTLRQQMNEVSSNEGELSVKPPSEAGFLLDCDLQEDVELLTASTAMMTVASDDVQDHQPAQKMNPVVSEEKYGQEDTDLSPDKEENNTETTSSESDIWRPTHHSCATTGFVTSEGLSLEVPHVALKDNRETTAEEHGVTTEGAEDVHKFSNIRRKLGSSRKNKRPPPGKDLEVSDGAAENTPEDDLLDASQVSSSTEEVEVTHQVPRESHRGFELQQHEHGRDKKSGTLTHDESLRDSRSLSESHVMAEEAELRTEAQPDEELEDLHPAGGVVQTLDLTEVCDKELNTKPADSEESQRRGGIEEVAEMLPQSDHEHRGAESSGSGTEETLKTTQWLVSTGPDEKESELTCEGETVTSEPPESFWSGSPPEVQNLNTSHPEPDDGDASGADEPPNTTVGQDREADGQVDDVKRRSDQLLQEHKDLPSEIEQSCSSQALQPEEGSCLDPQPQQSDACFTLTEHKRKLGSSRRHKGGRRPVELLTASTAMMTVASDDVQDHQPAQKMNPVVSEEKYGQEDTDLSPDKEENNTETTSSESDIWRPTHHSCATTGFVTSEGLSLEAPHVALKDQDSPSEGPVEGQQKPVQVCDTVTDEGAQETSPSEPTNAELTSSDPSSSLCFQKTVSADPAMEVAGEHEPGSHLDDSLHFQQRSKQRRRKMGSTRWTNKSPEVRRAAVTENSDSAQASQEGVERPAEESGETNTEIPVKLPQDEANVTFDPQNTHSNLIARPEGVNPTILVDGSGLWGGNSREPSQLGAPPPSFQSTQDDQESPPEKQEQPLQSAEESAVGLEKERSQLEADEEHKDPEDPDKVAEGGYVNNLEPENAGPDLDTANGRRMMGSTCRSPTSLRKGEDLHHQQKVDDETADEQRGEGSSERRKEPVKDTHLLEPPPLQTSEEASTTSESDHQPTTSPENDIMSDTLSSKRRRKLGSHRKSSRPQNHKTQTGSAAEHTLKIDEEDKISEVDEDRRNSANTSSSEAGGLVNPVSSSNSDLRSAPRTLVHPEGCLSPEDQPLPLAGDGKSNSYSVIMVGNSSVGKTSFMKRVLNGRFSSDLPSSVGLDMCLWPVTVDGKRVVLQLWDTAGQERFHSVTRQIFHKAHAFLLMYDISSTRSFTAVSYWANCIQEGATENVTILLLGNKSDCAKRQVPTQDGESLAKEYAFGFMECSAATGHNVKESLETVARILSNKVKPGKETTVLHKEPQQKKSSGCC